VTAHGARGLDTEIILPLAEAARGWQPERENDYFGSFHATHSTSRGWVKSTISGQQTAAGLHQGLFGIVTDGVNWRIVKRTQRSTQ
jgi:hypothetical protein